MDELLRILENPVRRTIIERLSQEPNYPLQLSKELGLGQQLVTKHLKIMEESGLIKSIFISSPLGPRRKLFELAKSFSIMLDVAPNLFKQNINFFSNSSANKKISDHAVSLIKRRDQISGLSGEEGKMNPFSQILADIDEKLGSLEEERVLLLSIRNSIMNEASEIIQRIDDPTARRVLHKAFDEHNKSVENISQALNLREEKVRNIVKRLKTEFKSDYF